MKFNKFLTLMMVLVLSVVLAACGSDESADKSTDGSEDSNEPKEINLVFASEPPSLHPGLATDTTSGTVIQNTFEGLMTLENGQPTPAAAESYEISEDMLTYTFKLRDAQWTNGDPVTAEDFAYSWKWALDPANLSEYASILYPIKGAEAFNLGSGSVDGLSLIHI